MIKIQDKISVRRMMSKETQNFLIMIKQGITWYNLETENGDSLKFVNFLL